MNKVLLYLIFFTVVFDGSAQNINFPDPEFKAALLRSGPQSTIARDAQRNFIAIDANGDHEIDRAEALRVYELQLHNTITSPAINIISDATGIEYFTNVTRLLLMRNDLLTLDVSALSNLKELNCFPNSRLRTVNVAGLANLTELNLSDCNIETIDISGLVRLRSFYIVDNVLTTLNVSDCVNLDLLMCSNNLLQELDLSGLSRLSGLYCSGNQLTTLNLYGLAYLTTLNCSNNNLVSLNVKNTAISNLMLYNHNPTLEYICVSTNIVSNVRQQVIAYGYMNCVVDDSCDLATAEIDGPVFMIFPNPATDRLTIVSNQNATIESVTIYNGLGQRVFTQSEPKLATIDVTALQTGYYNIRIASDAAMQNVRFLKK